MEQICMGLRHGLIPPHGLSTHANAWWVLLNHVVLHGHMTCTYASLTLSRSQNSMCSTRKLADIECVIVSLSTAVSP